MTKVRDQIESRLASAIGRVAKEAVERYLRRDTTPPRLWPEISRIAPDEISESIGHAFANDVLEDIERLLCGSTGGLNWENERIKESVEDLERDAELSETRRRVERIVRSAIQDLESIL